MCQQTTRTAKTRNSQTQHDFTEVTVESFTQTVFLTVDSDPQAEQTWERFSCNNTVRGTSSDFLKSLQTMFKDKPAGQYLVKVETRLDMTTLDFEPAPTPVTQETLLNLDLNQIEAKETSKLTWVLVGSETSRTDEQTAGVGASKTTTEADGEFDPERHF